LSEEKGRHREREKMRLNQPKKNRGGHLMPVLRELHLLQGCRGKKRRREGKRKIRLGVGSRKAKDGYPLENRENPRRGRSRVDELRRRLQELLTRPSDLEKKRIGGKQGGEKKGKCLS